jgi:hypothetical protein
MITFVAVKMESMKKQILIGEESFEKIIEGDFFYIDKTLFIKELLENRGTVTLVTRPRRFGKTLNMSMLKCFFDINMDNKALFDGLKIMEHKYIVEKRLNKYPVVFLTLKNVEEDTYKDAIENISELVSGIFRKNRYLYESDRLDERQKELFYSFFLCKATEVELKSALIFLTECLYTYHKKRVIILLDEYDAPINNALMEGYYQDMIKFMRGFLGSVFKTNNYLEFGVLTGVQRVSKESLVSCFNNPKVCGIMNMEFADCFGFTEEEVKDACAMYDKSDKYEDVKRWYDGYRIGGQDMYNPWSIVQYLSRGQFRDYWANTGGMTILQDIFFKGTPSLKDDMAGLLTGAPIKMKYEEHITYPISYERDDVFWSMLLNCGYLKPCVGSDGDVFYAELVNKEVRNIFADCIDLWFKRQQKAIHRAIQEFVDCLLQGDAEGVSTVLNKELLNNPSCHDFKEENSYHMFIFGILLAVSGEYTVYSNPESGKGRSDCLIKPIDKEKYAVVIEFKHSSEDEKDLKQRAQEGLKQIEEKAYIHSLKKEGYERLFKYGIAFHKKNCEVAMEKV